MKIVDFTSKRYTVKSRRYITVAGLLFALVAIASCKKSKEEEEKPVFGTCKTVAATSHLSYSSATNVYTYTTHGGGHIKIQPEISITITHDEYPGFSIDLWGSVAAATPASYYHENLNGKHVKDRVDVRRTIIFPDGAKITFYTNELKGPVISVTIYDGEEVHHINPSCNKIEYSTTHSSFANELDEEEPDGEAGAFEFTSTGLLFVNLYGEYTPGVKVMNRVLIGELFRANPTKVNDYWP